MSTLLLLIAGGLVTEGVHQLAWIVGAGRHRKERAAYAATIRAAHARAFETAGSNVRRFWH
jgi:hypothetical protein